MADLKVGYKLGPQGCVMVETSIGRATCVRCSQIFLLPRRDGNSQFELTNWAWNHDCCGIPGALSVVPEGDGELSVAEVGALSEVGED